MTEETGSGNRWEPVGAPSPEAPEAPEPLEQPAPAVTRRSRRETGLLAGLAAALLFGGGAVGYTVGHVTGASADDRQPVQQVPAFGRDGQTGPEGGQPPPPGSDGFGDHDDDHGGFDPGQDDGSSGTQDET